MGIEEYLTEIKNQIRDKKAREFASDELKAHIEDRAGFLRRMDKLEYDLVFPKSLGSQLRPRAQLPGESRLLGEEKRFFLLCHPEINFAEDRERIAAIAVDPGCNRMLPVKYEVTAVAVTDLGLIGDALVEVMGDL